MATIKTDQVMSMVDSIFENIGYRRWVEGIQCLQNEQIYFEICNIVFHSHSIELIKINQSKGSSGEKLHALIQLVSKVINMDLSHISGKLIVQGNMQHLKNLLQLFEYLSQIMVKSQGNAPSSVRSAPQADSQEERQLENLNHTVFTVLATNDEFGQTYTDSEANHGNRHEPQPRFRKKSKSSKPKGSGRNSKINDYQQSESDRLEPRTKPQPGTNKKQHGSKKKSQPPQEQPNIQNLPEKNESRKKVSIKKSSGSINQPKQKQRNPILKKKKEVVEEVSILSVNRQAKLAYAKRMYQTVESLEHAKLKDIRDRYTRVEDQMIKKASRDQLQIRQDHLKLTQGQKQNRACLSYLQGVLQTDLPSFAGQLRSALKKLKREDRQHQLQGLQHRNEALMALLSDNGDIEDMHRMLGQVYRG